MDFSRKPFASVAALLLLALFTACSPAAEEPAALAQPSRGAHRGDASAVLYLDSVAAMVGAENLEHITDTASWPRLRFATPNAVFKWVSEGKTHYFFQYDSLNAYFTNANLCSQYWRKNTHGPGFHCPEGRSGCYWDAEVGALAICTK
jgi:hypothetical protein